MVAPINHTEKPTRVFNHVPKIDVPKRGKMQEDDCEDDALVEPDNVHVCDRVVKGNLPFVPLFM